MPNHLLCKFSYFSSLFFLIFHNGDDAADDDDDADADADDDDDHDDADDDDD